MIRAGGNSPLQVHIIVSSIFFYINANSLWQCDYIAIPLMTA